MKGLQLGQVLVIGSGIKKKENINYVHNEYDAWKMLMNAQIDSGVPYTAPVPVSDPKDPKTWVLYDE